MEAWKIKPNKAMKEMTQNNKEAQKRWEKLDDQCRMVVNSWAALSPEERGPALEKMRLIRQLSVAT